MQLPFTLEQFLGVFGEYHHRFAWVAAALWLVTVSAIVVAWWRPIRFTRALVYLLGALWIWNAIAYHALLFTRINPAAWLFAAAFLVQGSLLLRAGARNTLVLAMPRGPLAGMGAALIVYALLYPFLNLLFGHPYPGTPTFGVPCPTAIVTAGVLVAARGDRRLHLAVIPAVWAVIGGSAALLLSVWTDYVMLGSGLLLAGMVLRQRVQRRARSRVSA